MSPNIIDLVGPADYPTQRPPSLEDFILTMDEENTRFRVPRFEQAAHKSLIQRCLDDYQPGDTKPRHPNIDFQAGRYGVFAKVRGCDGDLLGTYKVDKCPKALL